VSGLIDGFAPSDSSGEVMSITTSSVVEVDGQQVNQPASVLVDSSTVFLVNGRSLEGSSASDPNRLTPHDVVGWPARIEYERVPSSAIPRATLVEFAVPQEWIDTALIDREEK
jgi:hypothetical protein